MKYYKRKFLNSKEGVALIESIVSTEYFKENFGFDAEIKLLDCHRQICLDFNVYNEKDQKEKFKKLDGLISELINFKEAMIKASKEKKKSRPKKKLESITVRDMVEVEL